MTDPSSAMSPPVDPERLTLRASPLRAIRFKRGLLIGMAGAGSLGLAATAWFALSSGGTPPGTAQDEQAVPAQVSPETVSALPGSYSDAPKLGPRLPGDLGGPILAHQRAAAMAGVPDGEPMLPSDTPSAAEQAAQAERERRRNERAAARQSALLVEGGARSEPAPTTIAAAAPADAGTTAAPADPASDSDPNEQRRKVRFLAAAAQDGDADPHMLVEAPSPFTLSAGAIIAASLVTGLDSDLPGFVIAQVTENVHDSATGRILLIPQGARLLGRYDSGVTLGQTRALVVWQRVVLPDGSSLRLDNLPATDTAGHAGLADRVDRHGGALLKGVALATLLGVGTQVGFGGDNNDLVRAIREATQQNAAQAGQRIVGRQLDVQPTIRVRPGWPVRVVVHQDIVLRPWRPQ
ncbi:TrbI/VirB10 family protein [Sphingomonas adhaesiva]|uniref:TrbI/VirB10 family protein n=1 Tax=Sphingomonas adhaesiva TaxID=28212 RepID=UPI002FFA229D